jgi:hypothetical protein
MSNKKTDMPKPGKFKCTSMVVMDCKRTNKPGWGELYDYGLKTGQMMAECGQSDDPVLLNAILERCKFERDAWLNFEPEPEYPGAAKQCINIENYLFRLGYDKDAMKAAQDETDRYIELSPPDWQLELQAYCDINREVKQMLPSCSCCDKAITGKRLFCGQCKIAVYCGTDCQKQHWSEVHREQCGKPGCAFCGKMPKKPMKCGKCLQVVYCQKECQIRHWKYGINKKNPHKNVCVAVEEDLCAAFAATKL